MYFVQLNIHSLTKKYITIFTIINSVVLFETDYVAIGIALFETGSYKTVKSVIITILT